MGDVGPAGQRGRGDPVETRGDVDVPKNVPLVQKIGAHEAVKKQAMCVLHRVPGIGHRDGLPRPIPLRAGQLIPVCTREDVANHGRYFHRSPRRDHVISPGPVVGEGKLDIVRVSVCGPLFVVGEIPRHEALFHPHGGVEEARIQEVIDLIATPVPHHLRVLAQDADVSDHEVIVHEELGGVVAIGRDGKARSGIMVRHEPTGSGPRDHADSLDRGVPQKS